VLVVVAAVLVGVGFDESSDEQANDTSANESAMPSLYEWALSKVTSVSTATLPHEVGDPKYPRHLSQINTKHAQ
jgi:hypothetical protein